MPKRRRRQRVLDNSPHGVVIHEPPGTPWDCWEDLRHTPAEEAFSFPTAAEGYLLRWEELLGRR